VDHCNEFPSWKNADRDSTRNLRDGTDLQVSCLEILDFPEKNARANHT